jgi:hypothetical protein
MDRERGHGDVHGAGPERQRRGVPAHEGDLRVARGPATGQRQHRGVAVEDDHLHRPAGPACPAHDAHGQIATAAADVQDHQSAVARKLVRDPPDAGERQRVAAEPGVEQIEIVERRA